MRNVPRLHVPTSIASIALLIGIAAPTAGADPAQAPRTPPESPAPSGSIALVDNPLIVNTHPLTVESWSRDGGASILLHFTSPAPACSGVHASTRESPDTVTVDLRGGWLPEAVGRVCPMIVVRGTLEVPLDDPVGNRQVVSS